MAAAVPLNLPQSRFPSVLRVQAIMLARAVDIRPSDVYLGFLEWGTWGHLQNRRVRMLFGSTMHDVMDLFAPGISVADPATPWVDIHVAAVVCTGTYGVWQVAAGDLPFVNHYVIGAAMQRDAGAEDSGSAGGAFASCTRIGALRAGWVLHATAEEGNCAVDAMAHFQGFERGAGSLQFIEIHPPLHC